MPSCLQTSTSTGSPCVSHPALRSHRKPAHGAVAGEDVLQRPRQAVPRVGHAVGRRRALVEHERRGAFAGRKCLVVDLVLLPEAEDRLFALREGLVLVEGWEHGGRGLTSEVEGQGRWINPQIYLIAARDPRGVGISFDPSRSYFPFAAHQSPSTSHFREAVSGPKTQRPGDSNRGRGGHGGENVARPGQIAKLSPWEKAAQEAARGASGGKNSL